MNRPQGERERVERGRVDARPVSERKSNHAVKLEPGMFQKLNWQHFTRITSLNKSFKSIRLKKRFTGAPRSKRCRRPPGLEEVLVALRGTSCIAFFDPISFENG